VAYSSVSHLGFCTLGIFALNPAGIAGSIIQQINHGISTGMLFLIVGVVYERRHTREIVQYGGLFKVMPIFTLVFGLAALSSMGMPPLNGFIGEITILSGAFQVSHVWAFWESSGSLSARRTYCGFSSAPCWASWCEEQRARGSELARNRRLSAADRLGVLDRIEPAAVLPCARPKRGANRRARATQLLRRAAPAQPAGKCAAHDRARGRTAMNKC